MRVHRKGRSLLLLCICLGIVSTTTAAAAPSSNSRQLLGANLQYVPSGCNLVVSVTADETQTSWFGEGPEIRGRVTLNNPNTYPVPISGIIVQARSSDGLLYSAPADCWGSSGVTVPVNPQPYTYGSVSCSYRIVLDRRVFGSYASEGGSRRRLLGDSGDSKKGGIHVNFFPGAGGAGGSDGGSDGGSGDVGFFPPSPPPNRASWTVVAVATVSFSNDQCVSPPTSINSDCWWQWLFSPSSWWWARHSRHHHWGRKLASTDSAAMVAGRADSTTTPQQAAVQDNPARQLLAQADNTAGCASLISPTAFVQANVDGSYSVIGQIRFANPGPLALPVSQVKVTVANTIAFRPMILDANCGGATAVPAFGSITCTYASLLPTAGASANPGVWNSAMVMAKVGPGGSTACNSAPVGVVSTTGSGIGSIGSSRGL